jgi:tetratricopeptide (TPR) repeat protein
LIVGYVHALNGNLDFAKNYFLKSINEILKSQPLNVQQLWALIANLLELPRFYRLNGDFKASIECIRNVIELWKKWNQGQHNFSKFLVVVNFSLFQFSHLSCLVLSC